MSTSALESEDLENVPLVRMEDVQPSRTYDLISRKRSDEEVLETYVFEDIEYDNECVVNDDDDDSNIGSMVSIKSEELSEDDSEYEMIVPEPINKKPIDVPNIRIECKPQSSWPTLEILPGGVIKKPEKLKEGSKDDTSQDECLNPIESNTNEMMYACAKCSQRFKILCCLVKHVKWHEDEVKKLNAFIKPKPDDPDYLCMHSNKRKMVLCVKSNKKKTPKKVKS